MLHVVALCLHFPVMAGKSLSGLSSTQMAHSWVAPVPGSSISSMQLWCRRILPPRSGIKLSYASDPEAARVIWRYGALKLVSSGWEARWRG